MNEKMSNHPMGGCDPYAHMRKQAFGTKRASCGFLGIPEKKTAEAIDNPNLLRKAYVRLLGNAAKVIRDCALMMQRLDQHYCNRLDEAREAIDEQSKVAEQGYEQAYEMLIALRSELDDLRSSRCPNCHSKVSEWQDHYKNKCCEEQKQPASYLGEDRLDCCEKMPEDCGSNLCEKDEPNYTTKPKQYRPRSERKR